MTRGDRVERLIMVYTFVLITAMPIAATILGVMHHTYLVAAIAALLIPPPASVLYLWWCND